jgi:hypothetical protein
MRHSELGRRNANLCVISHNAVIWTAWRITGHGTRLRKNNRHVPGNAAHPIGESLDDLLGYPGRGGMPGGIKVPHLATTVFHHDEHEQQLRGDRRHREEIDRHQWPWGVVMESSEQWALQQDQGQFGNSRFDKPRFADDTEIVGSGPFPVGRAHQ